MLWPSCTEQYSPMLLSWKQLLVQDFQSMKWAQHQTTQEVQAVTEGHCKVIIINTGSTRSCHVFLSNLKGLHLRKQQKLWWNIVVRPTGGDGRTVCLSDLNFLGTSVTVYSSVWRCVHLSVCCLCCFDPHLLNNWCCSLKEKPFRTNSVSLVCHFSYKYLIDGWERAAKTLTVASLNVLFN